MLFLLTYHDVILKRDANSVWFDCTANELEHQMSWLEKHGAKFVTLDTVNAYLNGKAKLPKNAVAITFADNYLGFYLHAMPILRKHKIPAAQFVHTGFVGSKVGRPKMSWDQIRELDREGLVTFGSQTVTHPADLHKLTDAQLKNEFEESRRAMQNQIGHAVNYLAYPNGKFDARCPKFVKQAGYLMAFTEVQKPADPATSKYLVSRYMHTQWQKAWADLQRKSR